MEGSPKPDPLTKFSKQLISHKTREVMFMKYHPVPFTRPWGTGTAEQCWWWLGHPAPSLATSLGWETTIIIFPTAGLEKVRLYRRDQCF